jgi:hypothetical protein
LPSHLAHAPLRVGLHPQLHNHTRPEESEEGEPVGRIISARKATVHERKAYEEGNF